VENHATGARKVPWMTPSVSQPVVENCRAAGFSACVLNLIAAGILWFLKNPVAPEIIELGCAASVAFCGHV